MRENLEVYTTTHVQESCKSAEGIWTVAAESSITVVKFNKIQCNT